MKSNYSLMYSKKNQNLYKPKKMHSRIKTESSINNSKNNIFLNLTQYKSKVNNTSIYNYNTDSNISINKLNIGKNSIFNKFSLKKIIDSYEKTVILLFENIKMLLEKNIYDELKEKFKIEFLNNLKENNKENKNSPSNSIKKILDECIKQFNNNFNLNNQSKNNLELTPSFYKSKPQIKLLKNEINISNISPYHPNQKNINSQIKKYKSNSHKNKTIHSSKNKYSFNKELFLSQNQNIISNNKKENNDFQNNIIEDNDKNNESKKVNAFDNNELLSKIKDSLDDTLKNMFTFSYENFLNKESERYDKK